jgi:4-hydroxy 2-oxovalerate aldolase
VCGGIHGAKLAIMADYGKISPSDFTPKEGSNISLIRLASHKNTMKDALILLQKIKEKGYETSIQAMGYSSYSEKEREELAGMLEGSAVDYAYMADSYGSIFPDQIEKMLEPLLELRPSVKIGFHPHNNLQMAFANSLEAIKCGVDIIDGSIFGMGRGAGNLPIEIVLLYLSERVPDKYNVVPILNCIDKYYIEMQENIGWGYQLSYMLSGLLQCHPSYAKKLVDLKEYTMEDILKALDCINKKNPVGFSEEMLTDVISQGIIGGLNQVKTLNGNNRNRPRTNSEYSSVPYIDRHKGETFLILANGPTLEEYSAQIQQFIDKYHPVVLGANYLGDIVTPDYHAFCNKRRFVSYMETVSEKSKLLIGQYIPEEMIREYTQRDYESIFYLDTLNNDFEIREGVIQCNCRTVSVLLLGLAIVMGADKIFAAGLDGYLNTDASGNILFYNEHDEKQDAELIRDLHRWNYKFISQINNYFLEKGKGGIHILTPTSYSEFYQGISNYI